MKKRKESFKEFKEKALHDKDTPFPILFIDPVSIRLAYIIKKKKLKISPTQITFIRLLLLFPLILVLLFLAPVLEIRIFYLLVAILFYMALFTDWLDGQLARGIGKTSYSGAVLDSISDRAAIIIFFTLIFSIGLWLNNLFLIFGAILLFAFKTFHMIIVTMMFYYDKRKTKDKDAFFTEEPARRAMGIGKAFSLIRKVSKYVKIKRWHGTIAAAEQYFFTIILLSLIMFFNLEIVVKYLAYFLIIFFLLFYLFRINSLLRTCGKMK